MPDTAHFNVIEAAILAEAHLANSEEAELSSLRSAALGDIKSTESSMWKAINDRVVESTRVNSVLVGEAEVIFLASMQYHKEFGRLGVELKQRFAEALNDLCAVSASTDWRLEIMPLPYF